MNLIQIQIDRVNLQIGHFKLNGIEPLPNHLPN